MVQVDIHYHQEDSSVLVFGRKYCEPTPFPRKAVMCATWLSCNDIQNFHFGITDQLNIPSKFPFKADKNKPVIN
ncbi:hypothetical protein X975_18438, partial [Stegodyphus mimosarum]